MSFLYLLIRLQRNIKLSFFILFFLTVVSLNYIRPFILIPLVTAYLLYLFFGVNIRIEIRLMFVIIIVSIFCIYLLTNLSMVFSMAYFKDYLVRQISSDRVGRTYGSLAYFPNLRFFNIGDILTYLPLGLFAVWFSPFPWQFFSFSHIFTAPEMIVWYLLLPFAIKGIREAVRNKIRPSYLLITTIVIFSIALALAEGNLGTLFRHRGMVFMLFFIFIGFGYQSKFIQNNL